MLRRLWSRWTDALVIVKPDTVVRWHRAGFKLYWNWISRWGRRTGRLPVDVQIRDLIHKMATENGWGAPRVHRELAMLGFDVSERTVSRYLHGLRRRPEARQGWLTFLRNHREVIAAMDLFVVCTATFRLLYVLVVIRHGRRQIVHFNVTAHWNRSRRPARRSSHQRQRRRRGLRPVASTTSSSRRHRGAEPASPATPASWAAMRRLLHLRPLVAPPSSKLPNIAINA